MGDNVAKMGIDETEKCRETRRRRTRIEMRRLAALAVGKMSQPALVPQQGESSSSMGDKRRDRSELTTGELKRGRGGVVGSCSGGSSSPSTWSSGAVESSSFGHAATAAAAPPPVFGVVSLSGRACDMEDAVTARTDFFQMGDGAAGLNSMHFFAVYDGHGGSHVALLCKERLHVCLAEELGRVVGEHASASAVGSRGAISETEWISAMSRCFQRIDEEALSPCGCEGGVSSAIVGSTAVVAVVEDGRIVVANCGDSRAVLSRGGRAVPLSSDHKPDRPDELARIEASGGRVIYLNGARVQGILAMSRALGDKYLKPIVISEPEVNVMQRNPQDEFIILASDGLWDVLSNDLACDIARRCLSDGDPSLEASTVHMTEVGVTKQLDTSTGGRPQFSKCSLAAALLTHLALGRRSSDNISVIVIDLKRTDEGST